MSSKADRAITEALGALGDTETFEVSSTTTTSGLLRANTLYRLDTNADACIDFKQTHDGNDCNIQHQAILFAGAAEVFATPSDSSGGDDDDSIHFLCSGLNTSGYLHATPMKTRK